MYICIYVYMYICMYVYMQIRIYVYSEPNLQHPFRYQNGRTPLLQRPPQCAGSAVLGILPTHKVPILRLELHSGKARRHGPVRIPASKLAPKWLASILEPKWLRLCRVFVCVCVCLCCYWR